LKLSRGIFGFGGLEDNARASKEEAVPKTRAHGRKKQSQKTARKQEKKVVSETQNFLF